MKNLNLVNCDTDSIMVGKPDGAPFSDKEKESLLSELNSLFPEKINWTNDGEFPRAIIFKAKNYILWDGKKIKSKGSALKDGKKETALKDFVQETVQAIIHGKENFKEIYEKYVKEAMDVKDIKRWASRKTLSATTYSSTRENEAKIIRAIENTEYKEGDRIWLYFKDDGSLSLVEQFNGEYDKLTLVKKLYNTSKLFASVLDHDLLYTNYSLKRNKSALEELIARPSQKMLARLQETHPDLYNLAVAENSLPGKDRVFRALDYFKPSETKVIIIGQDPYPNKEDACGLAFSIDHNNKRPPSLISVCNELATDLNLPYNISKGNLEPWAKQGVLLLNSVLTVEEGKSGSHAKKGWEQYTTDLIQKVINYEKPLVILAWGKYAQNKLQDLKLHDKVLVIKGGHPSPLNTNGDFFGKKYFSKANEFLKANGIKEIDWEL